MKEDKVSWFIKKIRKDNNLTQRELAEKYHVTYQAVSKWENGKNIPDMFLLKKMSKDFNVSLDDIFDSDFSQNNKNRRIFKIILLVIVILISITITFMYFYNKKSNFEFKTLSSNCSDYNITGSMAYNKDKTSIYISNVNYCGNNINKVYDKIECSLYENNSKYEIKIGENIKKDNITLKDFLDNLEIVIDNYSSICKNYDDNSLYLQIKITADGKEIYNKIPLKIENNC